MPSADLTGKLLGMLVHDFRTPLSSVLLHLELLEGASGLTADERDDAAYALASARDLSEMIEVTSHAFRLADGSIEPQFGDHDLSALAREATTGLGHACSGRRVAVDAPSPVAARCDRDLTRGVIRQLSAIACAGTPPPNEVSVRVIEAFGRARLEVADLGDSIPEGMRDQVFDEAGAVEIRMRHRALSRGIGPVFCRRAIRVQGGELGVSTPAEGRTSGNVWWFELPRASQG